MEFSARVAARLAELPGVCAVTLGGSRAQGTHRPTSDWDFGVYYRDAFSPQALREVGWPGEVSALGGWGGGLFNGGAWLTVDGRRVDVHYRDLASVESALSAARAGSFWIEPLMFHLAGIPSYLVVAELALSVVLVGSLPRPSYPALLRSRAPAVWWERGSQILAYARDGHGARGRVAQCAGLLVQGAAHAAHAVLAARGEWITNEKELFTRAGLRGVDELLSAPDAVISLCREAVSAAVLEAGSDAFGPRNPA